MAAPMAQELVLKIFSYLCLLIYLHDFVGGKTNIVEDYLLCRQCGHEVAQAGNLVQKPTVRAQRQRNDTILGTPGVLIQRLRNPQGNEFEVITAKRADIYKMDQAFSEHSWFPGFSWRICVCPKCGSHLGWSFEPHSHTAGKSDTEQTFIGLILDNLLHKSFADSLLVIPKSYRS